MAWCPLYSRRFRRYFDDDNFGGSVPNDDLFDPAFYQRWFNMLPRNNQPSEQQSTGGCPFRQQTSAGPVPQQTGAGPVPQQTGGCPFRQQTGAGPVPQQTGGCPFRQQTGAGPVPQQTGVCPLRQQQGTSVAVTSDKFSVRVDTRHFTPEEISVKTEENCVIIHGKHEEKSEDRDCYVKREFTRRYVLPEDVDPEAVKCNIMPNGHLVLEAPRKNAPKEQDKPIPVEVQHVAKPVPVEGQRVPAPASGGAHTPASGGPHAPASGGAQKSK